MRALHYATSYSYYLRRLKKMLKSTLSEINGHRYRRPRGHVFVLYCPTDIGKSFNTTAISSKNINYALKIVDERFFE